MMNSNAPDARPDVALAGRLRNKCLRQSFAESLDCAQRGDTKPCLMCASAAALGEQEAEIRADDERLRAAEARVWPDGLTYGCDAAEHLADEILTLRAQKAEQEAEIARLREELAIRTKLPYDAKTAHRHIDEAWKAIANGYDIEPREYFEREAPNNGFVWPLVQALHHIWKREPKVAAAEQALTAARRERDALNAAAVAIIGAYGPHSDYDQPYRGMWLALQYAIRSTAASPGPAAPAGEDR